MQEWFNRCSLQNTFSQSVHGNGKKSMVLHSLQSLPYSITDPGVVNSQVMAGCLFPEKLTGVLVATSI